MLGWVGQILFTLVIKVIVVWWVGHRGQVISPSYCGYFLGGGWVTLIKLRCQVMNDDHRIAQGLIYKLSYFMY